MITVVKIGGNIVDDAQALDAFLADFAAMPGKKILVHGGGKEATRLSAKLEEIHARHIVLAKYIAYRTDKNVCTVNRGEDF